MVGGEGWEGDGVGRRRRSMLDKYTSVQKKVVMVV
jgi:hypothetical protein